MSRKNSEHQRAAASAFCRIEKAHIDDTRSLVIEGAQQLLMTAGSTTLNRSELETALEHLEKNRLSALFQLLRDNASRFVVNGVSSAYWSWIDAYCFLFDATGVSWPYMTVDGRRASLKYARTCAKEALDFFDGGSSQIGFMQQSSYAASSV